MKTKLNTRPNFCLGFEINSMGLLAIEFQIKLLKQMLISNLHLPFLNQREMKLRN